MKMSMMIPVAGLSMLAGGVMGMALSHQDAEDGEQGGQGGRRCHGEPVWGIEDVRESGSVGEGRGPFSCAVHI